MEEEGRGKRGKRGRGGEREGGETADPHTQVFLSPKPDLITSSLIACCAISSHSLGNLCARYPFKKPFLHIQSESNFFFFTLCERTRKRSEVMGEASAPKHAHIHACSRSPTPASPLETKRPDSISVSRVASVYTFFVYTKTFIKMQLQCKVCCSRGQAFCNAIEFRRLCNYISMHT